jgi:hypothetical protein
MGSFLVSSTISRMPKSKTTPQGTHILEVMDQDRDIHYLMYSGTGRRDRLWWLNYRKSKISSSQRVGFQRRQSQGHLEGWMGLFKAQSSYLGSISRFLRPLLHVPLLWPPSYPEQLDSLWKGD